MCLLNERKRWCWRLQAERQRVLGVDEMQVQRRLGECGHEKASSASELN